jgi:hypothetical protein
VSGVSGAREPDEIRPLKPCLLRRNHSREQHGVAASCLEELKSKGWQGTGPGRKAGGARLVRMSGGDREGDLGILVDRLEPGTEIAQVSGSSAHLV